VSLFPLFFSCFWRSYSWARCKVDAADIVGQIRDKRLVKGLGGRRRPSGCAGEGRLEQRQGNRCERQEQRVDAGNEAQGSRGGWEGGEGGKEYEEGQEGEALILCWVHVWPLSANLHVHRKGNCSQLSL
jgi:hypothetical protein